MVGLSTGKMPAILSKPIIEDKDIYGGFGPTFRQAFSNVVYNTAVNRREKHREFDRCERQRAVEKIDFLNELSDLAARNSCSDDQEYRPKVYAFSTKGKEFVLLKK